MFKKLLIIGLASLAMSCGSNQKKSGDSSESGASGDGNSAISGKGISFDAQGSDSGAIGGLKTINFEYDKARLTTQARRVLAENAEWVKGHPEANVQIEGHCDKHGSVEYNLSLGERRAKAVKNYLVSLGVSSKRLSIVSFGEEKLLDDADSESADARNRRANFVPLPR